MINAHRIFITQPEGTTWKSRNTWEDNIKIDLKGAGCEGENYIGHSSRSCEHCAIKGKKFLDQLSNCFSWDLFLIP